jgi:hypothetical protein
VAVEIYRLWLSGIEGTTFFISRTTTRYCGSISEDRGKFYTSWAHILSCSGDTSVHNLFPEVWGSISLLGRSYDSCWAHYLTWRSSCSSQACIISFLADIYMWDGAIFKRLSSGRRFFIFWAVFFSVEAVSFLWVDQLPD